ncbi:MAG: alpha/beta hydrolase [Candidatus Omnitrophica bacterium]|nr:alpha/beta hydrolase [Candidatus Omnitrophota bacterium]MDD5027604.1 alpha/beta hydrolase [Candidatus Omnitrophota bacterium]MDD5662486.1 alpha/beta hydrolase [Candidatus Omnitrophota bacterium]
MKKIFRNLGILVVLAGLAFLIYALALNNKTVLSKDGVRIAYSVYGKGEPALVFVHGWCGSRAVWYRQIPYFAKKYKVVALDLAGHGVSGRQRKAYTQEAFGEDVAAVVNAVGADKVILIGHSMSGTIILEANRLIKDKVSGLIAIDTLENFERLPATPEDKIKYIEPLKKDFVKNSAPFMREMFHKNADPRLIEQVVRNVSRSNPEIAINTMEYYFDTPIIPLLADVDVPLWCLNADLWQSYPEINSKYLKSYHLRTMRGVGHFLMVEKPDEFNRQLEDIISQITK